VTTPDHSGTPLPVSGDGFLLEPEKWTEDVARFLARDQEGIAELGADHWSVIRYVRGFYLEHGRAPMVRYLCKSTGLKLKTIYELFPSGPAKGACKLAGLPNADGCV
jgi:tRNA 2-thiouridine synthesizing protein E